MAKVAGMGAAAALVVGAAVLVSRTLRIPCLVPVWVAVGAAWTQSPRHTHSTRLLPRVAGNL